MDSKFVKITTTQNCNIILNIDKIIDVQELTCDGAPNTYAIDIDTTERVVTLYLTEESFNNLSNLLLSRKLFE